MTKRSAVPGAGERPARPAAGGAVARLHLSAQPEPDAHLLDPRGGCALHPGCDAPPAGAPDEAGISVVVAAQDGVRVAGLPDPLPRGECCVVVGAPVRAKGIAGAASALSLDAALLPAATPDASERFLRVSDPELSIFLASLVGQLAATPPRVSHASTRAMARAVLSVLSVIRLEDAARASAPVPRGPSDELYARAVAVIREQIADPDLSPALIAAACSVTPRYLHMLFEKRGETVSTRILAERLRRCSADLADPELAAAPIAEIAARWGFSTPSHFSQKFRGEYGMTPREWRERALRAP